MNIIDHKYPVPVIRTLLFQSVNGVSVFNIVEEWKASKPQPGAIGGALGEILKDRRFRYQRMMLDVRGRFALCSDCLEKPSKEYHFLDTDQARNWLGVHKKVAKAAAQLSNERIQTIVQSAGAPKAGAEAA